MAEPSGAADEKPKGARYLEPVRAAGAVLQRGTGDRREVAVLRRTVRADWSLPKGKPKNSEHLLETALREVAEETGIRPILGRRLAPGRYLAEGWPKQVEWWSATVGEDLGFVPGPEIAAVEWLSLPEARARLTYAHEAEILDDAAAGPERTVPVVLLRHATAGRKSEWNDEDLLRPLDPAGREDALRLIDLLAAFGPMRVATSAAARCVETVTPYAVARSAPLRTEPPLTVALESAGGGFDVEAARAYMAALMAEPRPTVVCTHGELVPALLAAALDRLGAPLPRQPGLAKGSFWVLHAAADGTLAALERHTARP